MAISAIICGGRPSRPTHSGLTDKLWTLTQQCWDQDANRRPSALRISCSLYVLTPVDRVTSADGLLRCSDATVWKRLTGRHLAMDERVSLIADLCSDHGKIEALKGLSGDDVQPIIDMIDEVLSRFMLERQAH